CVKALIEKLDNDKDFVPERIVLFSANHRQCYANRIGRKGLKLCQ
ncbi:hypothetical protein, partial [Kingella kingae]